MFPARRRGPTRGSSSLTTGSLRLVAARLVRRRLDGCCARARSPRRRTCAITLSRCTALRACSSSSRAALTTRRCPTPAASSCRPSRAWRRRRSSRRTAARSSSSATFSKPSELDTSCCSAAPYDVSAAGAQSTELGLTAHRRLYGAGRQGKGPARPEGGPSGRASYSGVCQQQLPLPSGQRRGTPDNVRPPCVLLCGEGYRLELTQALQVRGVAGRASVMDRSDSEAYRWVWFRPGSPCI